MLPSYRTRSPVRIGVAAVSVVILGLGVWLVGHQLGASANPSVNGVCDSVDRCLEPTQASTFIGRAIEPDPDQAVGKHEWDFNGSGSFGTVVTCSGSACAQACTDGSHSDCSVTDYSYSDPAFFSSANERQVNAGLRGVDTEGAAGVAEIRKVGVAIAYVGPDRGSSSLQANGISAGGFTVTWRDVTDVAGSAYTLHVDNLDDGTGTSIPVTNDKAMGDAYSVAYVANPSTDYLVWVAVYYPTPLGPITRQSLPGDPIGAVPVTTPANASPTLTLARMPGNVPPGMVAPHYQLLRQPSNVLTLNVTAADPDGDQLAELRIDGLAALPGASFNGFSTPTVGPVTRTMTWNLGATPPPSGDYSVTVVARDVVGGTVSRPLAIRLNASPDAPSVLYVNVDDAVAGLPSGDPTPVAQVVDDNLADQNLKFTFRHGDPDGDAAATYRINVDTDSAFASPLTWDSGSRPLAVANGSRSANVAYTGPALTYGTDYWWQVQAGDGNGNLSLFGRGRFKLRPTNYAPVLGPLASPYSIDVGATLNVALTATDQDIADGIPQTLTYFAQGGLPSPRMALNPATGAFSFTPTSADLPPASPYTVTLCVRDSYTPPAQSCASVTVNVNLNLAAPSGLTVAFSSPIAGVASWTHSAPGEDGFQLDRTTAPARSNVMSAAANATNGSFAFNDCDSTAAVSFQVRAFVDPGTGRQFSSAAAATANRPGFAAPTGLTVAATGNASARISWTPGTSGQSGYAVFNGAARLSPDAGAAATTYDVTGLAAGNSYTFRVQPFVTIASCSPSQVLGSSASVTWVQPNPAISVSPGTLAFGNVVKDASSPTMTVRVTNSGSVTLTGVTGAIAGPDAAHFSLLNTPPASLAPAAFWDAQIQFRPTAYGPRSAQFQAAAPSFGVSANAGLTGTGVPTAPVITSASWDANEPSRYSVAWTWGPGDPDDFSIQMPLGTEQFRLTLGNQRARNNQLLTSSYCYAATGTTHTLNLLAFDGGYSAPATANLGTRPGWEPMGSPAISWIDNTTARLAWSDPAPIRSRYEVRVWNGATAVLNATTTDDATSLDLTGLASGTNYGVTIRAFRSSVDLPGCPGTMYVYSAQAPLSYRQPIIDLEAYIQGAPANPVELAELDGGGVWIGDDLSFPLRIHNNGDPLTITGSSYSVAGGSVTTPGIFSNVWPAPFGNGADWNTDVRFQAVSSPNVELTVTVKLQAGPYGDVLTFPVRVVPMLDGSGISREVFVTQATHIGDFGNSQAEAEAAANALCRADARANPTKSYAALLWFSNSPPPSTVGPGTLYRNQAGQFVFGTRPGSLSLPYTAHRSIASPGQSVWSGRGMSGPAYNCSNWTGGTGASADSSSQPQWSLAFGGASNCMSVAKAIYCVEVPALAVSPSPLEFGGVRFSDGPQVRAVTLTNSGAFPINVTGVSFSGGASPDFTLGGSLSGTVPAGGSSQFTVTYAPAPGLFGDDVATVQVATAELPAISLPVHGVAGNSFARLMTSDALSAAGRSNGNFMALPGGTLAQKLATFCSSNLGGGTWKPLVMVDGVLVSSGALNSGVSYLNANEQYLFTAAVTDAIPTSLATSTATATTAPSAWTGYSSSPSPLAQDCGNWTVATAPTHGRDGTTRETTSFWFNQTSFTCNASRPIYCAEQ